MCDILTLKSLNIKERFDRFLVLLGVVFVVSFFVVYNDALYNYLPGTSDSGLDGVGKDFKDWLWSAKTVGTFILIVLAGLASWVLTRK